MKKNDHLPIFEWTLINNKNDTVEIRTIYQIADKYNIEATTNNGNIIVEFENNLYEIDHEEPSEKPFRLSNDYKELKSLFSKLYVFNECNIETPLNEIKEIKKSLVVLKKEFPKVFRDDFQYEIDKLKDLISDYKFYKSDEGKRHLLTEKYKIEFYQLLNKPHRYQYIEVNRTFKTELIKISGVCIHSTENLAEIKQILNKIQAPYKVEIGTIISFEEYQIKLKELK